MKKCLTMFALLLVVLQTPPQILGKQVEAAAQGSDKDKSRSQGSNGVATQPSSLIDRSEQPISTKPDGNAASVNDKEHAVKVIDLPPVTLSEKNKTCWDYLLDWGPWIFSFGLLVVGIWQGRLLRRTWKTMNQQAAESRESAAQATEIAKKSADAALLNAKALINAERPWVMIQIVTKPKPGGTAAQSIFEIRIFNYGKSPAHILSCAKPMRGYYRDPENDLPLHPEYGASDSEKRFLAPKDSITIDTLDPSSEKSKTIRAIAAGGQETSTMSMILAVFGLIEYGDGVSDKVYRTSFCYRHHRVLLSDMGGSLVLCGPSEYNQYT